MIDLGLAGLKELSVQQIATVGPLMLSLMSLCLLLVLLRRRSRGVDVAPVESAEESPVVDAQTVSEVVAAQRELRGLVREFSSLAERVLRAVDQNQVGARLPDPGGTVMQLIEHGLTPIEAARVTRMSVGELALLMNLHRLKTGKGGLPATLPADTGGLPDHVREENVGVGHETIEVAGR